MNSFFLVRQPQPDHLARIADALEVIATRMGGQPKKRGSRIGREQRTNEVLSALRSEPMSISALQRKLKGTVAYLTVRTILDELRSTGAVQQYIRPDSRGRSCVVYGLPAVPSSLPPVV